jgi:hypothetical protein
MSFWAPTDPGTENTPWLESEPMRRRFVILSVVNVLLVIVGILGSVLLIGRAQSVPNIVAITAEQQAITGVPVPYQITPGLADQLTNDIIEGALWRTEKGGLDEVKDYLTPEVQSAIEASYSQSASLFKAGFVQRFHVAEKRLATGNSSYLAFLVRGYLSSRGLDGMQTTQQYLAISFILGPSSSHNPTGWRMYEMKPITKELFYTTDSEEKARLLTNENPTTMSGPSAASPAGGNSSSPPSP